MNIDGQVLVSQPGRFSDIEFAEIQSAIDRVLKSGVYVGGSEVAQLESELANFFGGAHEVIGTACGQDALELALKALALAESSLVITPPNDGGFSISAVQSAGLTPLVVDVNQSGLITVENLNNISEETLTHVSAIIITHLHGLMAGLEPIITWARQRGVKVIEDCSQSIGAQRSGRMAGTFGDVATFSFYPTKNLGALGDGGAVLTASPEIAEQVRILKQYAWKPKYSVSRAGGMNSRLDSMQAAILSARLPFLIANNQRRRQIVKKYIEANPDLEFVGSDNEDFVGHHAVVMMKNRESVRAHLLSRGIHTDIHYPFLNNQMPGVVTQTAGTLSKALQLSESIISLPCFPTMTSEEIERTIFSLHEAADLHE